MGMDVYGHKPTAEEGQYFSFTTWEWHPLADYICHVAPPAITGKCEYWHANAGDGLDTSAALELATLLQAEIDSGRCEQYAVALPPEATIDPFQEACNAIAEQLHGPGAYTVAGGIVGPDEFVKNVREFVKFLRCCGGFSIW